MMCLPSLVVSSLLVCGISAAQHSPSLHQLVDIAKDAEFAGARFRAAAAPYSHDKIERRIAQADLAAESTLHKALWTEMTQPELERCGHCIKNYNVPCPEVQLLPH